MLVSVHAEDEGIIKQNKLRIPRRTNAAVHSQIRSRDAAIAAVKMAIELAEKHSTVFAFYTSVLKMKWNSSVRQRSVASRYMRKYAQDIFS